jgi:diguanylate cyclase (GGDEF)-like protein/PAS domain S-box-containing protein
MVGPRPWRDDAHPLVPWSSPFTLDMDQCAGAGNAYDLSEMLHSSRQNPFHWAIGWSLLAVAAPLLWWVSRADGPTPVHAGTFLLWHTAIEMFAVVVAVLVFITGYRATLSQRQGAVVLLGLAFLGVGMLDFLHAMSYVGMPDMGAPNSPHKSIYFWLAARLLAACALLAYAWLPAVGGLFLANRRLGVLAVVLATVALAVPGALFPERIPALYLSEQGLTPLKVGLEWLTVVIHLGTLAVLWARRRTLMHECLAAVAFAVALSAVSELFMTLLGIVDTNAANAIGHMYKVVAYLYLFQATFTESIRRPMERLETQNLREKVILNAAPDGVIWVAQDGQILLANPAMEALSGYTAEALVGQNVRILLPPQVSARHEASMASYFEQPLARAMGAMDLLIKRRDGSLHPVDISLGYWSDREGRYAIAYIRDLRERKKLEESLRHRATHDELTALPNRWLFLLQLNQALARAGRSGARVAVIFLDLDYFKTVNDSFGHATGDALLVQVAARMLAVLRESDTLARLGGDEFAILLSDLQAAEEAVGVAAKLLGSFDNAFHVRDKDVHSGASLGLAFYPDDAQDSDTLLRYADLAMYQAKQAGRGAYACYSKDLDKRAHEDMLIHTRLKDAILQKTLQLHYQPQVDVQSGAVVGLEALLRWHDAVLGHVSPARFIPLAEATGLILPMSDWVLNTACAQIAQWSAAGAPVRVAVNFSAQQFHQRNMPQMVAQALRQTGASAHLLEIEITESAAMTHPQQAREQLDALVALGCSIALDDFGTGYSSLAYLKALPVSKLKISQEFIAGLPHDSGDASISRAVIALAHSLGMTLVAEGVEEAPQLAFLRANGCEVYQGWLFAKAMPAGDVGRYLRAAA